MSLTDQVSALDGGEWLAAQRGLCTPQAIGGMQISVYCNMTNFGKISKASVLGSSAKKNVIWKQHKEIIAKCTHRYNL